MALLKLKAINEETTKTSEPKLIFLEVNSQINQAELIAIEIERDRIQKEQANMITIIPAEQSPIKPPKPIPIKSPNEKKRQITHQEKVRTNSHLFNREQLNLTGVPYSTCIPRYGWYIRSYLGKSEGPQQKHFKEKGFPHRGKWDTERQIRTKL